MSHRIDRYIGARWFAGAAPALLLLLGLFAFLDLTEELEDVGTGAFDTGDAVLVMLMSLPGRIVELAPVSAVLGTLAGLGAMAGHQELNALRAAGFSLWRIAAPVCATVALVVVFMLMMQFSVVPRMERDAAERHARTSYLASSERVKNPRWIRSGKHIVRIGDIGRGRRLNDVEIFELGVDGELLGMIFAQRAQILGDGRWLLRKLSLSSPGEQGASDEWLEQLVWESGLSNAELGNLVAPVEALAPDDLYRYIGLLEENGLDALRYRVMFWQKLGLPLELFGMALLGLPFIVGTVRSFSVAQRVALGTGFGVLVYFSGQLAGHATVLYRLNPVLTALGPKLLLLALALVLLYRFDAGGRR